MIEKTTEPKRVGDRLHRRYQPVVSVAGATTMSAALRAPHQAWRTTSWATWMTDKVRQPSSMDVIIPRRYQPCRLLMCCFHACIHLRCRQKPASSVCRSPAASDDHGLRLADSCCMEEGVRPTNHYRANRLGRNGHMYAAPMTYLWSMCASAGCANSRRSRNVKASRFGRDVFSAMTTPPASGERRESPTPPGEP